MFEFLLCLESLYKNTCCIFAVLKTYHDWRWIVGCDTKYFYWQTGSFSCSVSGEASGGKDLRKLENTSQRALFSGKKSWTQLMKVYPSFLFWIMKLAFLLKCQLWHVIKWWNFFNWLRSFLINSRLFSPYWKSRSLYFPNIDAWIKLWKWWQRFVRVVKKILIFWDIWQDKREKERER